MLKSDINVFRNNKKQKTVGLTFWGLYVRGLYVLCCSFGDFLSGDFMSGDFMSYVPNFGDFMSGDFLTWIPIFHAQLRANSMQSLYNFYFLCS